MVTALRERPITILVLTVHGVGPSSEKISTHLNQLTENKDLILKSCLPDFSNPEQVCVDFWGIDWQSEVHRQLDVNNTLEKITPPTLGTVRDLINNRFVDVMLYLNHNQVAPVPRSGWGCVCGWG